MDFFMKLNSRIIVIKNVFNCFIGLIEFYIKYIDLYEYVIFVVKILFLLENVKFFFL